MEDGDGAGDGGTELGAVAEVDLEVRGPAGPDRVGKERVGAGIRKGEGVRDPDGPEAGFKEGRDQRPADEAGPTEGNRACERVLAGRRRTGLVVRHGWTAGTEGWRGWGERKEVGGEGEKTPP